jgi:hypothetical protein
MDDLQRQQQAIRERDVARRRVRRATLAAAALATAARNGSGRQGACGPCVRWRRLWGAEDQNQAAYEKNLTTLPSWRIAATVGTGTAAGRRHGGALAR